MAPQGKVELTMSNTRAAGLTADIIIAEY